MTLGSCVVSLPSNLKLYDSDINRYAIATGKELPKVRVYCDDNLVIIQFFALT
jgi:hypothetical protein